MYTDLYEYLILHHKLPLSDLGSFLLERRPAKGDFPNKLMHAPSYFITWNRDLHSDSNSLIQWLSHSLGVSLNEARRQFDHFISMLKESLAEGTVIHWKGVGDLENDQAGRIRFLPLHPIPKEAPVPAHKVIREKAEHTVRVGEDHRTVQEMTEMLSDSPGRRYSEWKIAAIAIAILSLGFIAWYISKAGLGTAPNQLPLHPLKSQDTTYRLQS